MRVFVKSLYMVHARAISLYLVIIVGLSLLCSLMIMLCFHSLGMDFG